MSDGKMFKKAILSRRATKLLSESEKLCAACLHRQGARPIDSKKFGVESSSCNLCRGASSKLSKISNQAVKSLSGFEFDTFLVGATIPQDVLDAEDEIRSRFKIRGGEGIKTQTTRAISKNIQHQLGKKIDYSRPDVTLLASLVDGSVSVIPRSLWLSASYMKSERGLPQRSTTCKVCNGVGCANCNYKGSSAQSIEAILSAYFVRVFSAEGCNFIWVGSEDSQSLVGGNGRPFFAVVLRPKKRRVGLELISSKSLEIGSVVASGSIAIRDVKILQGRPRSIPQFRVRCVVFLTQAPSDDNSRKIDSEAIERFQDTTVQVHLSRKFRVTSRKIYSIRVMKSPHQLSLEIFCDGGIPIRKLITGEEGTVMPNLSEYIKGYSIDQGRPFDILEVEIMAPRSSEPYSGPRRGRRTRSVEKKIVPDAGSEQILAEELLLED